MRELCRRHPLLLFFSLAFGGFWTCLALNNVPSLRFWAPMVGVFAPAASAVIVTGLGEGEEAVRSLVRRLGKWRVAPAWYAVALGLPLLQALVAIVVAIAIHRFKGIEAGPLRAVLPTTWLFFLFATGEELGWRGFALPRLLERSRPVPASLRLGAIHSAWHWPLILLPHGFMSDLPLLPWTVAVLAEALVFTWIFQATEGSVLLPVLWHGMVNASMLLFDGIDAAWMPWIKSAICVTTSVIVLLAVGPGLGRKPATQAMAASP